MSTTERAVSTDLAEALSGAIREAITDLLDGEHFREMVLDHLGSETVRKEVDRHIREAVASNEVASKEFRAMEARLDDMFELLSIQNGRTGEIEKNVGGVHHVHNAISERLEMAEAVLDATKALIDAEVAARRRDYAELNRLVHALEGGLTTLASGLVMLQGDEMRRQATPWRRLVRWWRGRKGAAS